MNKALLEQLKNDPETLKAAQAIGRGDDEGDEIFAPLTADDMTSVSEVVKEFNSRLKGLRKWVDNKVTTSTKEVTSSIESKQQEKEITRIKQFAKDHPALKPGSEIAAMMEQLYATGNHDLEDIYKKSALAVGVKPTALVDGKEVDLSAVTKTSDTKKKEAINSLKSDDHAAAADDVDEGELIEDKETTGLSTRQIADKNWNKAMADAGLTSLGSE